MSRLGVLVLAGCVLTATLGLGGSATGAADTTPPVIMATLNGTQGETNWFRSNVTISWSVSDPESGIANTNGCDVRTFTQETSGTGRTCWAENGVGLPSSTTVTVRIDKTAPTAAGSFDRPPDFDGWYTRATTASFSGTDALSGISSCHPPIAYAGPDTESAALTGSCRDRAGNETSATAQLKYDATAPVATKALPARRPDRYGWFGRPVRFRFQGTDATSGIASCDAPVYAGPKSAEASVSGVCRDRAGNASAPRTVRFKYSSPLISPSGGRNVSAPVVFRWVKVERARFYNFQLWKNGRKLLSAWPRGTSFRLGRTWGYQGRRYALQRGERYRWYVWPRLGSRYGRAVGTSVFDVVRPTGRAPAGREVAAIR